jgi:hypothetical protein
MVVTILQFRLKQLFRLLKSIGLGLLIIALPLAFVMVMIILDLIQKYDPFLSSGVILILILSMHFNRKDSVWLEHLFKHPYQLFLIEYNALLLPISILSFALLGVWKTALFVHVGASLISLIPSLNFGQNKRNGYHLNWIPIEAFEMRIGVRRYFWILVGLYLFGLLTSTFIFGVLSITILFGLLAVSFYDELEPKEFIENIHFSTPLLTRKIVLHSLIFHTMLMPLYVLFLVFHAQYWWLLLTACFIAESFLLYAIFFKYAHYLPGQKKVYNSTAFSIFALGYLVPFFFPASLWSLISQWRKAVKRIQFFYADHQ